MDRGASGVSRKNLCERHFEEEDYFKLVANLREGRACTSFLYSKVTH